MTRNPLFFITSLGLTVIGLASAQPRTFPNGEAGLATPVTMPFEQVLPGPVADYEILTARGEWGKEYMLETRVLGEAGHRFAQDKGRSAATHKPWLCVRNRGSLQGIAVLLAYSGNWVIEVRPHNGLTVLRVDTSPAGLKPYAEFGGLPVPGALVAEFTGHWDNGCQPIVRFIRGKLRRDLGPDWPPVQYNTWYAEYEKISAAQLLDCARVAAELGCELFTVDAGWYGSGVAANWSAELGNWQVNRERFPDGLEPVVGEVRRLGMKFGLWVEIECASPRSAVAKEHPDWILRHQGRDLSRRTALDFGKLEVVAWAKATLDRLVTTYSLDYLKLDFNTDLLVAGEGTDPQSDPLYRHYRGLAGVWQHLRTAHPKLIVENCSSGSLRQDAATAALTDTHWVSDNVKNPANLAMNFAATYLFPPEICSHWTTTPGQPGEALDPEASFSANMLGHMGLSGKIHQWDPPTRKIAAERIAFYKQIRSRIRASDVFHLTPQIDAARPGALQAALYVDPVSGQATLFAFQGGDTALEHTILLRGLQPDRDYLLRMPEGFGTDCVIKGNQLVGDGLALRFPRIGAAAVILIEPQ